MPMKTRRFFSVFLLVTLLFTLSATPAALAEETEKSVEDPNILARAALLVDEKTGSFLYG